MFLHQTRRLITRLSVSKHTSTFPYLMLKSCPHVSDAKSFRVGLGVLDPPTDVALWWRQQTTPVQRVSATVVRGERSNARAASVEFFFHCPLPVGGIWTFIGINESCSNGSYLEFDFCWYLYNLGTERIQPRLQGSEPPRENVVTSCAMKYWRDILNNSRLKNNTQTSRSTYSLIDKNIFLLMNTWPIFMYRKGRVWFFASFIICVT